MGIYQLGTYEAEIITTMLVRHLLGPLGLHGVTIDCSWTQRSSKQLHNCFCNFPPLPAHHPLPISPTPSYADLKS